MWPKKTNKPIYGQWLQHLHIRFVKVDGITFPKPTLTQQWPDLLELEHWCTTLLSLLSLVRSVVSSECISRPDSVCSVQAGSFPPCCTFWGSRWSPHNERRAQHTWGISTVRGEITFKIAPSRDSHHAASQGHIPLNRHVFKHTHQTNNGNVSQHPHSFQWDHWNGCASTDKGQKPGLTFATIHHLWQRVGQSTSLQPW